MFKKMKMTDQPWLLSRAELHRAYGEGGGGGANGPLENWEKNVCKGV